MHITREKNQWLIASDNIKEEVTAQWFQQEYWLNQGRLLGASSGRGSAWVIKSEWGKWILRHYYRGGLYANFIKDSYLWAGLARTRVYQEFKLLEKIHDLGLPSPKPIAALIQKKGLYYKNDLIMQHIDHQKTMAKSLIENDLPLNLWQQIGRTISQYHHNGIYHSDLNAHNILLSSDQVFIIDFDKGCIKNINSKWQQKNMIRLKRSIEKITQKSCDHTLKPQWQALMDAYRE